jgi:hypothetical protein
MADKTVKISILIKALEEVQKKYGDLPVFVEDDFDTEMLGNLAIRDAFISKTIALCCNTYNKNKDGLVTTYIKENGVNPKNNPRSCKNNTSKYGNEKRILCLYGKCFDK